MIVIKLQLQLEPIGKWWSSTCLPTLVVVAPIISMATSRHRQCTLALEPWSWDDQSLLEVCQHDDENVDIDALTHSGLQRFTAAILPFIQSN